MMMAGTPKLVAIIPSEGSVIQEGSILNVAPNQLIVRLDDGQVVQATQLNLDTVKITGSNNVPIQNGFVGVGDNPNEVVVRFANPLPDDFFTLSISSIQTNGGSLSGATVHFRVDLGAQVVAVVPQPITRNAQGRLVQAVDTIDVYFNNDKLNPTNAQNPAYYQLIRTQDTATNADDGPAVNPLTATYDAAANKVTLKFRSNDLLGYSQTFRLRIGNSDPVPLAPPPALQVDDVEIVEGDTGTANALFTVRLSKESNRTVTVGYATESPLAGSVATPGIDYATVAGVLTFAPGVTTQTIAVPIAGDSIDEHSSSGSAAEKFVLRLSNATNALITRATATGSIIDDDGAPYVTIGNVTKLEGDGKTTPFVFTVRMLGVALQPVTVKYRTIDASAVSSVDFSAVSGALTFAPGQQEKSITVNVSGDTNLADDKQFYLLLSDASNATILGGVAVGTILNDDGGPVDTGRIMSDPGSTFNSSFDLGTVSASSQGIQSVAVTSSIDPQPYFLQYPGDLKEPGKRRLPEASTVLIDNLTELAGDPTLPQHNNVLGYTLQTFGNFVTRLRGPDPAGGVPTIPFNFQDIYGADPAGVVLHNLVTQNEKDQARQAFALLTKYLGVQFVETPNLGLTIATGDMRAINRLIVSGPGDATFYTGDVVNPATGIAQPTAVLDSGELWDERGPESTRPGYLPYFRTVTAAILQMLGVGEGGSLPGSPASATEVAGSSAVSTGIRPEQVFPGDADIVSGQHLYRPDSNDIDMYRFSLDKPGTVELETIAQRLAATSQLNAVISVYDGNRQLIARNDDYFSKDSFVRLQLQAGQYFVAITSTGNTAFDPNVLNSGQGGTTQGLYQLHINFIPAISPGIIDTTSTAIDGDSDGRPGGAHNFWFKAKDIAATNVVTNTIFVDKAAPSGGLGALGSLDNPYRDISSALAKSTPGQIVRVVGNAGVDGKLETGLDAIPYQIGTDIFGNPLPDGRSVEVPAGVTMMIDAGAVIKLAGANIDVGSSAQGVGRAGAALQVLGTPTQNVFFTSLNDKTLGFVNPNQVLAPVARGDWGGLVFRDDSDLEQRGIFLNYVHEADFNYGGGSVVVNGVPSVFNPIHLATARPSIAYNTITNSADAAMSADPNSFEETEFQDLTFTADYKRVGPDLHHNQLVKTVRPVGSATDVLVANTINALFVRIRTNASQNLDPLTVSARVDERDIPIYLSENLVIQGQSVGYELVADPRDPRPDRPTRYLARPRLSARLALDPGVVMKLNAARIEARQGGQLIAEGGEFNPVVFTSAADDSYGSGGTFDTSGDGAATKPAEGNWAGIYVGASSSASLDRTVLTFAGGQSSIEGGFDNFNAIEIHQAQVRVANSIIKNNSGGVASSDRVGRGTNTAAAIFVRGSQPIIVNNTIQNNEGAAISVDVNSLNHLMIVDSGRSTGPITLADRSVGNHGALIRGNRLTNPQPDPQNKNRINGMVVRGGTVTTESVWDDTDIVHVVLDEILVPDFNTYTSLRLQSNSNESLVVKFSGANAGFTATGRPLETNDRIGGTVQVVGVPGHPVVLTSLADDTVGAGFDPLGRPQVDTNNANGLPKPGDWRSIQLRSYSNDRNVDITSEFEHSFSSTGDTNGTVATAQSLGSLAPDEKSGDDNLRLGFEVHGTISQAFDANASPPKTGDVDVYSFKAKPGTEVWFDIDSTSPGLDSVLELIDANNAVVARSNDSADESDKFATRDNLNTGNATNPVPGGIGLPGAGLARVMQRGLYSQPDRFTTNIHDAGMRVVLPGDRNASTPVTYYVRVRAAGADLANLTGGSSVGGYQLQVRLGEVDEVPGSAVRFSDIRYATTGIDIQGKPEHSPLTGEATETTLDHSTFQNAQYLGNLLSTDRGNLTVAGNLNNVGDIDWYSFDLSYDLYRVVKGLNDAGRSWSTMFDIDYADGVSRPDLTLSVFDANGRLLLIGRDSNVIDDQVTQGTGNTDAARGSYGGGDPLINMQLPEGPQINADINSPDFGKPLPIPQRYYVAITSSRLAPQVLSAYYKSQGLINPVDTDNNLVRLEPVDSIKRIAEDHISFTGPSTVGTGGATPPRLNLAPQEFHLGDVVLYGITSNDLYTIDPFTGTVIADVTGTARLASNNRYNDMVLRNDGRIFAEYSDTDPDDRVFRQFRELSPENGAQLGAGGSAPEGQFLLPDGTVGALPGGVFPISMEALSYVGKNGANRSLFSIGQTPTHPFLDQNHNFRNALYRLDPNTGDVVADNVDDALIGSELAPRATLNSDDISRRITVSAGNALTLKDGDTLSINAAGANVLFEIDLGVTLKIDPAARGSDIAAGAQFSITDHNGQVSARFRIVKSVQTALPGVTDILIADSARAQDIAAAFTNAIRGLGRFQELTPRVLPNNTDVNFVDSTPLVADHVVSLGTLPANRFSVNAAGITDPTRTVVPLTPFMTAGEVAQSLASAIRRTQLTQAIGAYATGADVVLSAPTGQTIDVNLRTTDPEFKLSNTTTTIGGRITGMAMAADATIYAVTDTGQFLIYSIPGLLAANGPLGVDFANRWLVPFDPLMAVKITDATGQAPTFSGLTLGPPNADNGQYANTLFATTSDGRIIALDTQGVLQPVFANGATSISTGLSTLSGIGFSTLDFNLWHRTVHRGGPQPEHRGHGVEPSWFRNHEHDELGDLDQTAQGPTPVRVLGGTSYWFGLEHPDDGDSLDIQPGIGNFASNAGVYRTYDQPGGSRGSLISNTFSLESYSPFDKPTLYFNYFLDTQNATSSVIPPGMLDAVRVYISDDGVSWSQLATNNSRLTNSVVKDRQELPDHPSTSGGLYRGDNFEFSNQQVQELFDNTGVWRQSRIDLGDFAGVKRNELTVVGGGAAFRDGETFTITDAIGNQTTFEFDLDNSLVDSSHFRIAYLRTASRDAMITTIVNAITLAADQNLIRVDAVKTTGVPTSTPLNRITIRNGGVAPLAGQPTIVENSSGLAIRSNSTLRLRFDFDTAASLNVGDLLSAGPTTGSVMTALPAADLRDGDIFTIGNHTFEFDKGFTLNVKAGANALISDGDTFTVTGTASAATFEFDRDGSIAPGHVAVTILANDSPEQIAEKIKLAIVADGTTGVVPIRNSNRVDLGVEGISKAQNVVVSSSGISVEGDAPGAIGSANATPVLIDGSMDANSVAIAVAAGLDRFFTNRVGSLDDPNDFTTAKLSGPLIRIIAQKINDGGPLPFNNYLTGKSTPATPDFFDGNYGAGRGDNRHEGVYIDDVVIGFADHGEIVTGIPHGTRNTDFFVLPDGKSASTRENVVTSGAYQLQIRSGQPYSRVLPNGSVVRTRSFDPNDRATNGITLDGIVGSTIYEGQRFTISDGANSATFEFTTDDQLASDQNLAIYYSADDAPDVIAAKIRAAINAQRLINVKAGPESPANLALATRSVQLSGAVNVTPGGREQLKGTPDATVGNESFRSNDTITTALDSGLNSLNPGNYVDVGEIGDNPNLLGNRKGLDVDMISLEAKAGDHIRVTLKSLGGLNAGLSLFGPDLSDLSFITGLPRLSIEPLQTNFSFGLYDPDSSTEPTLDFIVPLRGDGTYYIAVSEAYNSGLKPLVISDPLNGNTISTQNAYDTTLEGSGRLSKTPVGLGKYEIAVSLNAGAVVHEAGDDNTRRDQGYTVISNNQISNVSQFAIAMTSGQTPTNVSQPHPSPPQNLRVLNPDRLVPGVAITNNVLNNNGQGGIQLNGDVIDDPQNPNPLSAVPVVRVVNNSIFGATTAAGVGIQVGINSSPTILNNILANLETAISVDPASTSAVVIGYNLYQKNTVKFNRPLAETQAIDLLDNAPLFVNAAAGNFYLAAGSRAIDSAIDSLQDRAALQSVTGSIGIPPSPILAPDYDMLGQLRIDDPSISSAPGLGSTVFKDRGAIDRADFSGPSAVLANPIDNDGAGIDQDPAFNVVSLAGRTVSEISLRFVDANGTGIDDVFAADLANYIVRRRVGSTTTTLVNGVDYVFTYDATNNIARFAAAAGIYIEGSYTILLTNSPPLGPPTPGANYIRDVAGNALLPNAGDGTTQFTINISAVATSGWQNSVNNLDVNNDTRVTPLDVLTVINRLNLVGPGKLPTPASPPPFYDVNGDGLSTPLDALVIINFLNQRAGGVLANSLFVTPVGLIDAAPLPPHGNGSDDTALAIAVARSATTVVANAVIADGSLADAALDDVEPDSDAAPAATAENQWEQLLDELAANVAVHATDAHTLESSITEEMFTDPLKEFM